MRTTTIRALFAGAVLIGGLTIAATPALVARQHSALAEQVRARCVGSLKATRAWSAQITRTERGTDGKTSVVREKLLVRKPGEYRLTMTETDEKGRPVVSTTIRTGTAVHTRRVNADGSVEMHVLKGVRPSLGVVLDNELGRTISAVSEAPVVKVVGRRSMNGRDADELALGPGHSVWIDATSGLPVAEQVTAGDAVLTDVAFSEVVADPSAPDALFDPASLGGAETTTVEDLGFRPVNEARAAARIIGFTPLRVACPQAFSLDVQGYADPSALTGDGPAEAAFVSVFSDGPNAVLVTQVNRPELHGKLPAAAGDDSDGPEPVRIGSTPALRQRSSNGQQIILRGDVLVTVEGSLPESDMETLVEGIR